jgi:hypothetical protein
MAGHSRSKNGVASLAYVPAIHVQLLEKKKDVDARHKAGHDVVRAVYQFQMIRFCEDERGACLRWPVIR